MRSKEEIEALLAKIQAEPGSDYDYIAGIFDGVCAALGWAAGKTDKLYLGGD